MHSRTYGKGGQIYMLCISIDLELRLSECNINYLKTKYCSYNRNFVWVEDVPLIWSAKRRISVNGNRRLEKILTQEDVASILARKIIVMLIINILIYTSPNNTKKNIKLSNILMFRWKSYCITHTV